MTVVSSVAVLAAKMAGSWVDRKAAESAPPTALATAERSVARWAEMLADYWADNWVG